MYLKNCFRCICILADDIAIAGCNCQDLFVLLKANKSDDISGEIRNIVKFNNELKWWMRDALMTLIWHKKPSPTQKCMARHKTHDSTDCQVRNKNSIPTMHQLPSLLHDDVIKWKHFSRYWPCVRGIHRSPVNSPHEGQWRGALMFSLLYVWINGWVNHGEAGDLRRHRAHYDVIVMGSFIFPILFKNVFLRIPDLEMRMKSYQY